MDKLIFGQRVWARSSVVSVWYKGRYIRETLDRNHMVLMDVGSILEMAECKVDPNISGHEFVRGQEVEVWDKEGEEPKQAIFRYYDPSDIYKYKVIINGTLSLFVHCRVPQTEIITLNGKKYKLMEDE